MPCVSLLLHYPAKTRWFAGFNIYIFCDHHQSWKKKTSQTYFCLLCPDLKLIKIDDIKIDFAFFLILHLFNDKLLCFQFVVVFLMTGICHTCTIWSAHKVA